MSNPTVQPSLIENANPGLPQAPGIVLPSAPTAALPSGMSANPSAPAAPPAGNPMAAAFQRANAKPEDFTPATKGQLLVRGMMNILSGGVSKALKPAAEAVNAIAGSLGDAANIQVQPGQGALAGIEQTLAHRSQRIAQQKELQTENTMRERQLDIEQRNSDTEAKRTELEMMDANLRKIQTERALQQSALAEQREGTVSPDKLAEESGGQAAVY